MIPKGSKERMLEYNDIQNVINIIHILPKEARIVAGLLLTSRGKSEFRVDDPNLWVSFIRIDDPKCLWVSHLRLDDPK